MGKMLERRKVWFCRPWQSKDITSKWGSPDQCGTVGCVLSHKVKGCCWFDSWSGHMLGLWVQALVEAHVRGNQSMFLSHIDVSLPVFLPSALSKNK